MTMRVQRLRSHRRSARLRGRRGFTLVELMISMAAGLIIASAAFLMARNATAFFQHEAGITSAQYSSMMGFSRLQADLRRAAFMSTPNVQVDPHLCGGIGALLPGMQRLSGITIENQGSYTRAAPAMQGVWDLNSAMKPDGIIIGGTFDTTEQFSIKTLVPGGGGAFDVVLDEDDGAMVRTRLALASGAADFNTIFRIGRILRVVDTEGRYGFGVIANVAAGPPVTVSLSAAPTLPTRAVNGNCGCEGWCVGAVVNPVSRMRYDLRNVDPATYPQYAGLYAQAAHGAQVYHRGVLEPDRTELVRVELDASGNELPATLEVLAEYAIDLKFGIVAEEPQNPPLGYPELDRYAIGAPDVYTIGGPLPAGTPELVRAVSVRFSTRAHKRDRDDQTVTASDGGLYRFNLGANAGYARMRTLVTDVQLPNQARDILLP
jgi:prepilin-type N-terminal cleavage/methylation domain-containing protein